VGVLDVEMKSLLHVPKSLLVVKTNLTGNYWEFISTHLE